MVLVETPELPPLFWAGVLSGGAAVGLSTEETITSLVTVTTSPSSFVLSIWVLLVDVRKTGGDEGGLVVVGVLLGCGGVETRSEVGEGDVLGLAGKQGNL